VNGDDFEIEAMEVTPEGRIRITAKVRHVVDLGPELVRHMGICCVRITDPKPHPMLLVDDE
jgi:hypothetical protein